MTNNEKCHYNQLTSIVWLIYRARAIGILFDADRVQVKWVFNFAGDVIYWFIWNFTGNYEAPKSYYHKMGMAKQKNQPTCSGYSAGTENLKTIELNEVR